MIETDEEMTGIGECESLNMMQQCASMLIGEGPIRIHPLLRLIFGGWFDSPVRVLDEALRDIKKKALAIPLCKRLGVLARENVKRYVSGTWRRAFREYSKDGCGFKRPAERAAVLLSSLTKRSRALSFIRDALKSAIKPVIRACRPAFGGARDARSSRFQQEMGRCGQIRLHPRPEPLARCGVEGPLRSENPATLHELRSQVRAPIAVAEQQGAWWEVTVGPLSDRRFIELIPHATVEPRGGGIRLRPIDAPMIQ